MGRTERLFRITSLLRETKKIRFDDMLERLQVSPATLKRDLKYLRENLGTPIHYDAFERAYRIDESAHRGRREIPGFWFEESELLALAFACRLLEDLDPQRQIAPRLKSVIDRLAISFPGQKGQHAWMSRVRLFMPGRREVQREIFDAVTVGVIQRRRLRLNYFTRSRGVQSQREVSPQRLTFQKTWYLDAYCHRVQALRRFALDAVVGAHVLDAPCHEEDMGTLERTLDGAYGAFAGEACRWATLLFTAQAAQWVANEHWHPMQRIRTHSDGGLELMVPYRDATELVMDILRHGDQVLVLGDEELQRIVKNRVVAMNRRLSA